MLRKAYTPARLFTESILFLLMGSLMLLHPEKTLVLALDALRWLLPAGGIINLTEWLLHGRQKRIALVKGVALLAGGLTLVFWPRAMGISISLVFGLWMALNCLCKLIYAIQLKADGERGWLANLLAGIMHGLFAALLLLCGCSVSTPADGVPAEQGGSPASPAPQELVLPYVKDASLDPLSTTSRVNQELGALLFDSLVELDGSLEPSLRLAKSIDIDGLTMDEACVRVEQTFDVLPEKVELLRKNFERDSICRAAAGQREAMICPKSLRMQMQGCMRIRKNFTAGVLCPGATGTRATR